MSELAATDTREFSFVKSWTDKSPLALLTKIVSIVIMLFLMANAAQIPERFNVFLPSMQVNAIFLGAVLFVLFLTVPASGRMAKGRFYWWDALLAVASVVGTGYVAINALSLMGFAKLIANPTEIGLGIMTLLLVMEAVRRVLGLPVVIVMAILTLYLKFGSLLPGMLSANPLGWPQAIHAIYTSTQGLFGPILQIGSEIAVVYVVFGVIFSHVGAGEFMMNLAMAAAGRYRGGPAKAGIVGSALFGTMSGSAIANVAVTGSITIPMMKKVGYSPVYAAAIEGVASVGGIITPPVMGTIAFIMAIITNVPYATIALSAAIPAFLYYFSLYLQVDMQAAKMGIKGMPPEDIPSLKDTLKSGWEFALILLLLIVLLLVLRWPVPMAGVVATGFTIIVGFFRKKHRRRLTALLDCLELSFKNCLSVGSATSMAGVLMAALLVTGLGPRISSALLDIGGHNLIILAILAAIVVYLAGMFADMMSGYILMAALVAPAMVQLGVPMLAAHFFILYLGAIGFFTPPMCPAVWVTAPMAGADPNKAGLRAMQLGIVLLVVPFIILWDPALILIGSPGSVAVGFVSAVIGVFGIACGIEGYLFGRIGPLMRLIAFAAGMSMIIPEWTSSVAGAAVIGTLSLWKWWQTKKSKEARVPQVAPPAA